MEKGRFELKRNAVGRVYFIFKNDEDVLVAVSQSFPDRAALETCITSLRNIVKIANLVHEEERLSPPCFLMKRSHLDHYHFVVIGFYGEILIQSEDYADLETCRCSVEYLKAAAAEAKIVDFL